MWKQRGILNHRNYIEKSTWKQREFFDHWNHTEKATWKQRGLFDHQNYIEKSTWKQRGFSDQRNYVEKSTWKRLDFLTIAITSKKYAEMTWKFVEIWFLTYRRNIHVESTWIRRGVPIGILLLALDYCDFARIQVFPEISFLCGLNTRLEFNISLLSLIQFSFSCNSMISPVNLNLPFWKRCFIRNTQTLKMWICQVFKKLDLDIFNWIKPCYSNYNVP